MKKLIVLLAAVLTLSLCSCAAENDDAADCGLTQSKTLVGHYVGVGEQGMIIEGDDGQTYTFTAGLGIDARYLKEGDYIRVEYKTEPMPDDGDENGDIVYVNYIIKIDMMSEETDDINSRNS